jgi:hypothetical protein
MPEKSDLLALRLEVPPALQFSLQEFQLLRSYFSDHQWAEGQKALPRY